jgi:dinuclear metal center YbgI/SA1388 family protein
VSVRLADAIAVLERAYPPRLAQSWDSVGLVCGDPSDEIDSVTVAVDATRAVVAEVPERGMLLAHHPLLLRGVDTVAASTPKGGLLHDMIRTRRSLFTAHTNADAAMPGVSDALAAAIGLTVDGVLAPASEASQADKWVVYVAPENADAVREAMIGSAGIVERVTEDRIEAIAPASARAAVLSAVRAAHPHEEPAFDVLALAPLPSDVGFGRVGTLAAPEPLRAFVSRVSHGLPATSWGVRAAGDPDAKVSRVAVCGGAGDSLLDVVADAGVDAYVTADLRHHPVDEHRRASDVALVDVAHWASEFPWCAQAADVLGREFGASLAVRVCDVRTDPWNIEDEG